jgi:hypothetical protein
MRRALLIIAALLISAPAHAQWVVHDPAVIAQDRMTAVLKQSQLVLARLQEIELELMARRLSALTSLQRYAVTDTPEWRIHDFEDPSVLYARRYHAALNYGDGSGQAYLGVALPRVSPGTMLDPLPTDARQALTARLATLDVADATMIAGTNDDGEQRYNGRKEEAAIEALEQQVVDPQSTQSATAILDKVASGLLIGARNRQARLQFLTAFVEQLLVDTKRARDTEAGVLNAQIVTWRDGQAADDAFVAGTGDALHGWREP